MKRSLLLLAAVMIVTLAGVNVQAVESTHPKAAAKTVALDPHYRWHEGRWWYAIADNKWMVWVGSTWVPYEQFATCPKMFTVSQVGASSAVTAEAAQNAMGASQPAYSGGGYCPTASSSGSTNNFAGYGWSWGPGTALRNGPGGRF